MYEANSTTNIQKDFYTKRDLIANLPEEPEQDENQPIIDKFGEELMEHTTKNIMNTMLPSTKALGKRQERPENPELDEKHSAKR